MKQTNNAIKFLLAQYRAIFKQAYLKGLVSAVVLTTGLAAGSANAADDLASLTDLADAEKNITIDGTTDNPGDDTYVNIKATATTGNWNGTLLITGGEPSSDANANNFIKADSAPGKLTGSGTLTISGSSDDVGLTLLGGTSSTDNSLTIDIGTINVERGVLNVSGSANAGTTAIADTITLGVEAGNQNAKAVLTGTDGKAAVLGDTDSTITVHKGGSIELKGYSTVNAANLTVNNGTISTSATGNAINIVDIADINGGKLTVADGAALTLSGTKEDGTSTVTFSGTDVEVSAGLTLQNGIFDLTNVKSFASNKDEDGKNDIVNVEDKATLKVSGSTLQTFVSGSGNKLGTIDLKSGSTLVVSGELNLATTGGIDLTTTVGNKGINSEAGAKITADTINLLGAVSGTIAADISAKAFNFKGSADNAKLSSLTVTESLSSESATTLANAINLVQSEEVTAGKITGAGLVIDTDKKGLNITGKWESSADITVSGSASSLVNFDLSGAGNNLTFTAKTLKVGNSGDVAVSNGAALTIKKGATLDIDGNTNSKFSVNNADVSFEKGATLNLANGTFDISNAEVDLSQATITNAATTGIFAVNADGSLILKDFVSASKYDIKSNGIVTAVNASGAASSLFSNVTLEADSTLAFDNLKLSDTGAASISAPTTGTVQINKLLSGNGDITLAAGNIQFGADANSKGIINQNLIVGNTTTVVGNWSLTGGDKKLTAGANGELAIGDGSVVGTLTADQIVNNKAAAGSITVNSGSTLTVNGIKDATKVVDDEDVKINAGEAGYAGFDLAATTVSVDGGTFVIGSTAADQLLNNKNWTDHDKKPEEVELNYVYDNFGTYELSNDGILKVDFSSGSFSVDQFKQMKVELVGADEETGKIADGTINIGNAEIAGVTDVIIQTDSGAGTSGEKFITFDDYNLYKDVLTSTQQEAIMQAQLREVVTTDSEALDSVHVGSIQLAQGETAVDFDGSSSLNNADNAGTLISNSNGEAADANLNAGASLALNADGAVADIFLAAGVSEDNTTVLNVNKQNSFDSIVGVGSDGLEALVDNTVVNVAQGATATIKDKVLVDTLNNQGVIKSASGSITVKTFADTATSETSAKTIAINDLSTVAGTVTVTDSFTLTSNTFKEGSTTEHVNSQITGKVDASAGQANLSNTSIMSGGSVVAKTTVLDKDFYVAAGGYLKSDSTVIGDDNDGNATSVSAFTTIEGTADLGDLSFAAGTQSTYSVLEILDATVTAKDVTGTSGAKILVGQDSDEQHSGIFEITGTLDQNGLSLVVDPSYEQNTALVAVNTLSGQNTNKTDVGIFSGNVYVGQNSALGVGVNASTLQSIIAQYQENGHFVDPNDDSEAYGAMLYLDKPVSINSSYGITITAGTEKALVDHITKNGTDSAMAGFGNETYAISNVIYLGSNTALALNTDKAISNRAYIQFVDDNNEIVADSKVVADGGEIVLYGTNYKKTYQIFNEDVEVQDLKGNSGSITVVSQNGFLEGDLTTGGSVSLNINQDKMDVFMGNTSTPVQQTIVAYLNGYNGEYAEGEEIPEGAYLGSYDKNGKFVSGEYNNDFLSKVVLNGTGADVEKVARLGVYGGTAQAALTAGASTYEAVAGRMGVGAQNGNITFADNGQGAGLWVTPVYKNHDSDGFGAQGLSYGADLDLYGVALGADYTLENGLRVGAAFNVGSGDADGQGAGAGVTNDFDYYGFTVYGGFTMDQLSVVADVSYTAVDNDVEANTSVEKVSASMDSSNLSFGVTAQYAFDMNGVSVTPHAGLRYTNIDLDDYTVRGSADIAKYSADSASVFSIPVGVTFAKEITSGAWTIKPALDLTLTANMGDDSVDGSVTWAGVENLKTNLESEVIDSFTYGAALGVSAKSGNMSFGFGVNYTGASSADEYGVSANARFVF